MHKTDISEVDRHMIASETVKMDNHRMPDGYAMLMKPHKAETAVRAIYLSGNVLKTSWGLCVFALCFLFIKIETNERLKEMNRAHKINKAELTKHISGQAHFF